MLLGTYAAKLAENHRTSIPSPLRTQLGENIIIAKWYETCLVMFALESFDALLSRIIGEKTLITDPVRGSEHFIFASAFELSPDDQGRIVIPENLVSFANLGEDIYFLGVRDRVEIWSKNLWDKKEKIIANEAREYIERVARDDK